MGYVSSCGGCSPGSAPLPVNPPSPWYPPSSGISPRNMCCLDGCGTNGWIGWNTKEAYCPIACPYCYGYTVNTSAEPSSGNMCCTDGCGTNGWMGWTTKAAYCPYACPYCFSAPTLPPASTMPAPSTCGSWCQNIPIAARANISDCSGCSPPESDTILP